ncbi:cysteine peptidase family C39 domain-containing protein [Colwellia sp. MSW7]|uniref:Cysteine peptidase family C39 domain-containing protein n=1 Tax=Colwellia maritima TaxID=2912588 RepID=A0ABS9WYB5_9GAMM|nr:cysteine peptidase family C39 domain-containing protein [Colwellia maritima]MCI2282925.1 cysteine peptidase family C39 domain-containing protein [Colwellia maritima]
MNLKLPEQQIEFKLIKSPPVILQSEMAECGLTSMAMSASFYSHKLATPCILHWDLNHFVVLTKVAGKGKAIKFSINDPAVGKRVLSMEEFGQDFTGICLELTPTSKFEVKEEQPQMKFTQLWSSMSGLNGSVQADWFIACFTTICFKKYSL